MKKLALSTLLAIGGNNAQKSNSEIMEDQPAISDGIIFNQGGETHQVSYLDREFSEDDVNVTCSANNMCIQLKKSFLAEEGITTNYDGIHLKNCDQGVREGFDDETAPYITVCTELGFNTCGTEMHMNKTHVSYLNRLFTTNGDNQMEKGSVIVGTTNEFIVPWHCVYPLEYLVGLESGTGEQYGYFIPKIYDVVTVTLLLKPGEGEGEFPVAMMLYKDDTYEEVYNEPPTLNVTDRLYVQSHLLKGPNDAVIQTRRCWATSTEDVNDPVQYTLIEDFCEESTAKQQAEVDVVTNGIGNTARWEANVFKFVNKAQVHLHCAVRICINTEDNSCLLTNDSQDMCANRRRRRAVDGYLPIPDEKEAVVSIGPLTLEGDDLLLIGAEEILEDFEKEIVQEIIEEEQNMQLPGYFIYALLGCLVTVVGLLVAVLMLTYKRRQNQKELNLEGDN